MKENNYPDINVVYSILTEWACNKKIGTYSELSNDYCKATGVYLEPHGSWDYPLGEINTTLAKENLPAISCLVTKKDTKMPGNNFWGCAPNVPPRPKDELDRLAEWSKIVKLCHEVQWPENLFLE